MEWEQKGSESVQPPPTRRNVRIVDGGCLTKPFRIQADLLWVNCAEAQSHRREYKINIPSSLGSGKARELVGGCQSFNWKTRV